MDIILLIIGVIIGYLVSRLLSGAEEGQQKKFKSLKFTVKNYIIHLHHWFTAALVMFLLLFLNWYNSFIVGLLAGMVIQGITYKDFYRLIYKKRLEQE
jgi:uncharacterized membrane-anchored protein YhcB (DUF1043 family)